MASRSYRQASDFLNYSPRSASNILAEWKSQKKIILKMSLKKPSYAAITL